MRSRRTSICSILVLAIVLVLAACAPATSDERVEVQQLTEPLTYYPAQTGARWEYLPDGARLTDPRLVQTIEGPTVLDGEVWTAWTLFGRGLDLTSFRQARSDGVYLKRRLRPGTIITFDPPIREFPAPGELRVGATWAGNTTANLRFPTASPEHRTSTLELSYTYTVVDERSVSLLAGDFDVYVVNLVTRTYDEDGSIADELQQETWFVPFIGEVRTDNGYFLVDSNVLEEETEEETEEGGS
jgi:hypothetical protein